MWESITDILFTWINISLIQPTIMLIAVYIFMQVGDVLVHSL